MAIRVSCRHVTHYRFDRSVNLSPHVLRLRHVLHVVDPEDKFPGTTAFPLVGSKIDEAPGLVSGVISDARDSEKADPHSPRMRGRTILGQTLQQFRLRRRFEKPSSKKRRKEKAARFAAMLKARYADE